MAHYVLGLDYGTDSVRAVLTDTTDGSTLATSVYHYPRWKEGLYCNPDRQMFRQHPLDYVEGLEHTILEVLGMAGEDVASQVVGIAVDTTGSTPVAVDESGQPLALQAQFSENPNAMFVLWKDHTAIAEAQAINALCARWDVDYTRFEGGIYSSEWFWAKILHLLREDPEIRSAAYSWIEHCDWIPFLLTGGQRVMEMKRSRCAAGHKALWHPDFGGLPPEDFFQALDPLLAGLRSRMFEQTYTSDQSAGTLSPAWAQKLGLSTEVEVAVGAFDAHMGAVGGQIEPFYLSKVMGTSTCDMLVAPEGELGDAPVRGICGQVDGSVIPGMVGLEAGQSAFGDVYAWFMKVLMWPVDEVLSKTKLLDTATREALIEEIKHETLPVLSRAAAKVNPQDSGIVALDWLNGRRTPDANQELKGALFGLHLGSDAPKIFRALVEATCFGARHIVDRFQEEGIPIRGVIGLGGVAKKSPFVMQVLADVLNRPIRIARAEQTCALGAAMFAAVAARVYTSTSEAMKNMGQGFDATYHPDPAMAVIYDELYLQYRHWGHLVEAGVKKEP